MTALHRKTYLAPQFTRILIAGVGGTGSYLAQGLAKLCAGYRLRIDVTLADPDSIEPKNCARQNFHPWEIGLPKAEALASRLNQQYGLDWGFVVGPAEKGAGSAYFRNQDALIVTCVDTVTARKQYKDYPAWLDLGNGVETGQALYGTTADDKKLVGEVAGWEKTPSVGQLPNPYRAFAMAKLKDAKQIPSCADTPFAEQGVFANEWAAAAGLTILQQLLVKGELTTPAVYFDSGKGRMTPEYITKDYLKGDN